MIHVDKCLWCNHGALRSFTTREDGVPIVECSQCHLVMLAEIPEALKDHFYTEEYYTQSETNAEEKSGYDEIYELMAPAFLLWEQAVIAELATVIPRKTKLLEVGCATGALMDIVTELSPQVQPTGIDISDYAVWVAQQKGHEAYSINVEDFKAKQKFDIIFSSETLEHLDRPRDFLKGIKQNLGKQGAFVFYVPSINRLAAKRAGKEYVRFTNNLEHLLHFTPEFMEDAMKEYFGLRVSVKEFDSGFGPYLVGIVTANNKLLNRFNKLMNAVRKEQPVGGADSIFNTAVISLKFSKFKYASKLSAKLKHDKQDRQLLLAGLMGYHEGHLVESNKVFQQYLAKHPTSLVALKSLYANERLLYKLIEGEFYNKAEELSVLKSKGTKKQTGPVRAKIKRLIGRLNRNQR